MQEKVNDKLVEKCTENIDEVKLPKITLAEYENIRFLHSLCCIVFSTFNNKH